MMLMIFFGTCFGIGFWWVVASMWAPNFDFFNINRGRMRSWAIVLGEVGCPGADLFWILLLFIFNILLAHFWQFWLYFGSSLDAVGSILNVFRFLLLFCWLYVGPFSSFLKSWNQPCAQRPALLFVFICFYTKNTEIHLWFSKKIKVGNHIEKTTQTNQCFMMNCIALFIFYVEGHTA